MMADNTRAAYGDVPDTRGFPPLFSAGMSDKTCSLTFKNPPREAEGFVNPSFRLPWEGSDAVRLAPTHCVQGGDCQVTVPSLCECLSQRGNEKAAPQDRSFPATCEDSEPLDGVLEGVVDQVRIDLGGREVAMPERPLDQGRASDGRGLREVRAGTGRLRPHRLMSCRS